MKKSVRAANLEVSVIIPVYNVEPYILRCLSSLLAQRHASYEIIIVDDCSTDLTEKLIRSFSNKRIVYLRNKTNLGAAASRNKAIEHSRGKYLFFTDGDCIVSPDWIVSGLAKLRTRPIAGVEGKIYFVSELYSPTYTDRIVRNETGGHYMTANVAYTREAVLAAGCFDPSYKRMEDRDLALKILKKSKIEFCERMVVYHQHIRWTMRSFFFNTANEARDRVLFFKRFGEKKDIWMNVYMPLNLLSIVLPPLVLGVFFLHKFRSVNDFRLVLLIYPRLIYERWALWKYAYKERVFLI